MASGLHGTATERLLLFLTSQTEAADQSLVILFAWRQRPTVLSTQHSAADLFWELAGLQLLAAQRPPSAAAAATTAADLSWVPLAPQPRSSATGEDAAQENTADEDNEDIAELLEEWLADLPDRFKEEQPRFLRRCVETLFIDLCGGRRPFWGAIRESGVPGGEQLTKERDRAVARCKQGPSEEGQQAAIATLHHSLLGAIEQLVDGSEPGEPYTSPAAPFARVKPGEPGACTPKADFIKELEQAIAKHRIKTPIGWPAASPTDNVALVDGERSATGLDSKGLHTVRQALNLAMRDSKFDPMPGSVQSFRGIKLKPTAAAAGPAG